MKRVWHFEPISGHKLSSVAVNGLVQFEYYETLKEGFIIWRHEAIAAFEWPYQAFRHNQMGDGKLYVRSRCDRVKRLFVTARVLFSRIDANAAIQIDQSHAARIS